MPDTDKVIKDLTRCQRCECDNCTLEDKSGYPWDCTARENLIDYAIAKLKELEATKPKTGHWIFESSYYEAWSHTCSECGKRMTTAINMYANWCWNCGAKMEGR